MVKKSIIATAVICMLASVTFAADPFPGAPDGQIKIDGKWPVTCVYTPIDICKIPVYLKVGMFIEILDCGGKNTKIVLEQVNCPSSSEDPSKQSFPCYADCLTIEVRANFPAQLGLRKEKTDPSMINGNNWKAYFRANSSDPAESSTWLIVGDGSKEKVDVCVEAWDVNIYGGTPGSTTKVGDVYVTAMPTGVPVCN